MAVVAVAWPAWGILGPADDGPDRCKNKQSGAGKKQAKDVGAAPMADFNCDGKADLVSTSSAAKAGGHRWAGYVTVDYGSDKGIDPAGYRVITQGSEGVPGEPGKGALGQRAVARDFDGDGYTDLALSVSVRVHDEESGVIVVWGSADGLKDSTELKDAKGVASQYQLVGGDFDSDGQADLALGVGEKKGLLKGPFTRDGASAGTERVPGSEGNDQSVVVAGDMTGDGADDLVAFHDVGNYPWEPARRPEFIAGGADGFEKPDTKRVPRGDQAAVGDVDGDGTGDLIVRERPEDTDPESGEPRALRVLHGKKDGPDKARSTKLGPEAGGELDEVEDGDFGEALDTGDVNGDGYADVAIASPGASVEGKASAGTAYVATGGPDGLSGDRVQKVDQATGGKPADIERGDEFSGGSAGDGQLYGGLPGVRLLDSDGDGRSDLAANAPEENESEGAVRVLLGTDEGLTGKGARSLGPDNHEAPAKEDFAQGFAL
ncbi:esterase [Streptomyces sp. WAC 06738]|nr:esterase [Streptomyces sp. WAC 06738]